MREIPRIKLENGKVVIDIFIPGNPNPIFHIKGSLKSNEVREQIAILKEKFGEALFSDLKDLLRIKERTLTKRIEEDIGSLEELKKEFEEIGHG